MRLSEQIFPRQVVLIATSSAEGKPNVMTASFVMPVSFEPKFVAFSISPDRLTFENLKQVPEFTMNILSDSQAKEASICGAHSGRDADKFTLARLDALPARKIHPPVIYCPISFECKVSEVRKFGDHYLVVGIVVDEWIREEDFTPLLHKSGKDYMRAIDRV